MLELVDKDVENSYYKYSPYVQEHDEKMKGNIKKFKIERSEKKSTISEVKMYCMRLEAGDKISAFKDTVIETRKKTEKKSLV